MVTDDLSDWWHKNGGANAIDISRPHHFKRMGLVFRTEAGCYVTPYNVDPNCWDQRNSYIPMSIHLTIVAVSAGASFSGWENHVPTNAAQRPAQFLRQPSDVTATAGSPAAFTVQAIGSGILTYQWQVASSGSNFSNVNNSNSPTLDIASAQASTSGFKFRCIVGNEYGTATSSMATLTVTTSTAVQQTVPRAGPDRGFDISHYTIDGRVAPHAGVRAPGAYLSRLTANGVTTLRRTVVP
jgi:hypothetical protein